MDTRTIFLAVAMAASSAVGQEPCSVLTPGESQVVAETNAARASAGGVSLVVDCRLMSQARRHARRLARDMAMYHSGENVGENVASGPENARDAVVMWLASPGHRANILRRDYRRIGVAGFIGPNGKTYWVQQFAP